MSHSGQEKGLVQATRHVKTSMEISGSPRQNTPLSYGKYSRKKGEKVLLLRGRASHAAILDKKGEDRNIGNHRSERQTGLKMNEKSRSHEQLKDLKEFLWKARNPCISLA